MAYFLAENRGTKPPFIKKWIYLFHCCTLGTVTGNVVMWECQWKEMKRTDPNVKTFMAN